MTSSQNSRNRVTLLLLLLVGTALQRTQAAWVVPKSTTSSSSICKSLSRASRSSSTSDTALFADSEKRRFAQPNSRKKNYGADSKIASVHAERIRTAGRIGTKRFVDPCKVFVGNLPYNVDDKQMEEFILSTMGQSKFVLHSSKVIHDWKTGKSKGFGFMVFTDPIYATVCMDVCNGKTLDGRQVSVSQGKKKDQENQLYIKKKKQTPETDEEAAIASALELAESDDEDDIPIFGGSEEDLELDAKLFGMAASAEDDDDDDDYDGFFIEPTPDCEGEIDPNLNRQQRREAARRLKKKKMPHKGFG